MARNFLTGLKLVNLDSDPGSGSEGELYFNTSSSVARIYKSGAWTNLDTTGGGSSLTQEEIQDYVAPLFTNATNTNVIATYDDANNVINLNTSGSLISVDSIVYPDYIVFDTTPETTSASVGTMYWDSGESAPGVILNSNVDLKLGQENVVLVNNSSGSTIAKGSVVYINGASGQRPTIALSDADTEVTSSKTLGLTAESIANGAEGFVTTFGVLRGVNTNGLTEGASLWLSSTAGAYTTTIPAEPAHSVFLGYVVKASTSAGEIFVNPQNGYELNELHGVLVDAIPADNEVLAYDTSSGLWINQTSIEAGLIDTSSTAQTKSGSFTSSGDIAAGGVLRSTASGANEGGQIELSLPSSGTTLSGTNVTIDIYQDRIRFFESGGTNRGAYIPLTSTGATVGTSLLGGTTGAMNASYTYASKQSGVSGATTLASVTITTNGYPIQVLATGDMENNSAGGWVTLQLYRGSTAIGNIVHAESSAGSENVPFALTAIDTPAAGTYTYNLKINTSAGGTFNFGESNGPTITVIELSGPKGDTGATGAAGTSPNAFTTISTPSGTSPVADSTSDTLTLTAGTGISITGDATLDSITIANTGYVSGGTDVSLADGGTNASLTASNGGIVYSTATAMAILSGTATSGQMLRSGVSGAPSWSTATFPSTATIAGTILRADGTNWVASTATFPNTATTANTFLRADGTNWVASSQTLVLSGNTTIGSSTNTVSLLTSGNTSVTLPTSGTLAINPTTTIGDIIYASITGTPGTLTRLAGNTAAQTAFLASTGNGTNNTTTSFISSTGTAGSNVVLATSPTITTPTVVTSLSTSTTGIFSLINTNTTAVNFAGSASAISIGAATGTTTINNASTVVTGDLAVNGGDITSTSASVTLFNTTATTMNIGGAATTVNVGASAGLFTVRGKADIIYDTDALSGAYGIVYAGSASPTSPAVGDLWITPSSSDTLANILRWRKIATAGQTVLSGVDDFNSVPLSYYVGYEQVYINGVLLYRGSDYTATDGSTITIPSGLFVNDTIEVISPSIVSYGDYYTQAQSDDRYGIIGTSAPYRMSAGRHTVPAAPIGAWSPAYAVSFPAGRFTQAPVVTVTTNNTLANPRYLKISDVTTTGFNLYQFQVSGGTTQATDVDWTAIQMSTSAYVTGTAQ